MKTKLFSRALALVLVSLMLLSAIACGKAPDETGDTTTTTAATTSATTTAPAGETTATEGEAVATGITDDLPADLNYNGAVITFLYREELANDFWAEGLNGDLVNDAIYESISSVEDRLNVDIQTVLRKGNDNNVRTEYNNHITNQVMAGDNTYDWTDALINYGGTLAQNGCFHNLLNVENIDLDKPWYIPNMAEDVSIAGRLFFTVGDASLGYLKSAFCIYFNRDLAKNLNIEDVEALALDGKWTIEKVARIAQQAAQDLNGDGKYDLEDQLGFVSRDSNHPRGFIGSTGMQLLSRKEDGTHEYTFGSDRDHSVMTALSDLQNNTPGSYFFGGSSTQSNLSNYNKISEMFISGKILMTTAEMDHVISCGYHGMTDEYGVLPYPKYEENQEEYRTLSRTTHNCFLMPITCKDPAMAGAVLEALGSSNYRTVMPAYFETALKVKYSYDTTASKIFDLIHNSMGMDFGYVYSNPLGSQPITVYTNILKNINTFSSAIKAQQKVIAKQYDKLVETINEKCVE